MKKNKLIIFLILLMLSNFRVFAQMTIWNNTAFVLLEPEEYSERIKKSQFIFRFQFVLLFNNISFIF